MNILAKKLICRSLLLMLVVMLSACVNTLELAVPYGEQSISHQSAVANAKAYFDSHFGQNTRSNTQTPTEEAPYVVGNLVPDWESGVTVANSEKAYSDFAMQKDFRYFLALKDEEGQMCGLELYSRLASVVDYGLNDMSQYVATYIPDISFLSCYEYYIEENLLTCEYIDWYTGVVLYTDLYGYHVAAYKYYDGELVDSSFLYDTQKTREENIADFMRVMGGVSLFIAPVSEGTRAVAYVDVSGGTYICCYDENTGKVYWEYYNIDPIPIVNTKQANYDSFIASGGSSNIGFGSHDSTTKPLIPTGGGGGGTTTTEEEKLTSEKFADKILKNSLSPTDSVQLHTMLTEILNDCMGQTLLQEIYNNGVQISIAFNFTNSTSQFLYYGNIQDCRIVLSNSHSEGLLHELFHFIQYNAMGYDACQSAYVNIEVEAHLASLMYMSHTTNSSAHSRYSKYCATTWGGYQEDCTLYLNADGSIPQGEFWEEMFRSSYDDAAWYYKRTHQNRNYDTNRNCEDNISNLSKLFENCD